VQTNCCADGDWRALPAFPANAGWRSVKTRNLSGEHYLPRMPPFQPCIPTAGKTVPGRPEWLHEVKYDGYRLIVVREDKRVRLITRNGHDWSGRYPWIVESALKNRLKHFVIDGEGRGVGCRWHPGFQRPALAQMR
jgi:ATP-dependent DNA ligase